MRKDKGEEVSDDDEDEEEKKREEEEKAKKKKGTPTSIYSLMHCLYAQSYS
jgi:hypothetical protein